MTISGLDPSLVAQRVKHLDLLLKAHAGGLRLVGVNDDGVVRVRFTDMCVGCPSRAVTMIGSVQPALLELEGVSSVEVVGMRLSAEASERGADLLPAYSERSNVARAIARLQDQEANRI